MNFQAESFLLHYISKFLGVGMYAALFLAIIVYMLPIQLSMDFDFAHYQLIESRKETIALGNMIYLWNASNGSASELVTNDEDSGPITSISWAPDGQHITESVVGLEQQLLVCNGIFLPEAI